MSVPHYYRSLVVHFMSRFAFTWNNPPHLLDLERIPEIVTYVVYQEEVGESGNYHFQGYLECSSRIRYTTLINRLGWNGASFRVARGDPSKNRAYCTKEDTRVGGPYEYGTMGPDHEQGSRTDLLEVQAAIRDGASDLQLYADFPSVMARYRNFVREYRALYLESQVTKVNFIPREGWQFHLTVNLAADPHPRKVIWVWSNGGNKGKSYFAMNYKRGETFYITGGKHADIYHAYNSERYIFFDVARSAMDRFPYEVLEKFKDGAIFKSKYESRVLFMNTPHVVVFANMPPDETKLSEDRWDIRNVD